MLKTASMNYLLTHKHVLLLQDKMGAFFNKLTEFLYKQGISVTKINFNAGDKYFYHHKNAHDYTGTETDFKDWLFGFVEQKQIDAIVCFADCRPHHMQAAKLCQEKNISFFAFEEGYLRPDYITFEQHGINGYSQFDIHNLPQSINEYQEPKKTNNRFYRLCIYSCLYYFVIWKNKADFPHYQHYRKLSAWQEAWQWLKAPIRKALFYIPDKVLLTRRLLTKLDNNYFLVCLQVHNDTQMTHHSDYSDVTEFITEVMDSFSKHADVRKNLVIKHHPLDRGHRDYRKFVYKLAKKLNIENRVYYGCDMHLPTIIKHSLGMVVVNSTTGLQSIYHQKPTKIMGRSLYDIEGLTDQQTLAGFWQNPQKPDRQFYLHFRQCLIDQNQLNGSFFGDSPWMNAY